MNTSTLITTDQMAREMRVHPETLRRKARSGELPAAKQYDGSFRFDRVKVFEALIREDMVKSLQNYLDDPRLPQLIRSNIETMIRGVRAGWLSVDQVSELMHGMSA